MQTFGQIRGAFRLFFAEKLRNFDFYENLQLQNTFLALVIWVGYLALAFK